MTVPCKGIFPFIRGIEADLWETALTGMDTKSKTEVILLYNTILSGISLCVFTISPKNMLIFFSNPL